MVFMPPGAIQRQPGLNPNAGEGLGRTPLQGGPGMRAPGLQSFKHGGKVKRTGLAKVERGERVLTKKQQRAKGMK